MKFIPMLSSIVLVAITACSRHSEIQTEENKFPVTSPIRRDTLIYNEYVCQIKAIRHIELRALEKGYLHQVNVDEGEKVNTGQLLFEILPVIYEAEVQKAKAELSFATIEYETTRALADSVVVSKNELAMSKANLQKAKADYDLAVAHLGFTKIKAPFNGIVGRFNDVRIGSLLDEGELLTTLSDNSRMWVYFNLPEAEYLNYMTKAKSKTPAHVFLQMANGQIFKQPGVVETIEADFNNETGNIAFRAAFPNPDHILRHGETGNILMPVDLKNALIIPQKATFEVLDKKYVYVVDSSGVITSREITIGTELPHLYVVTKGLKESDRILLDGLRKVKNNDKIAYEFEDMNEVITELKHIHAE